MSNETSTHDVAIVGAGPVGLALALSLARGGLRVATIERLPRASLAAPPFDGREIALTHRSVAILRTLGIWARIPAAEISTLGEAWVRNANTARSIRFRSTGAADDVLGFLVPNHLIRRVLFEAVSERPGIDLFDEAAARGIEIASGTASVVLTDGRRATGRLAVAADTRFSALRRDAGIGARSLDFGRTMLVCRMAHERPHNDIATEWFGLGQTIAMLPLNATETEPCVSSLVLTLPARETGRLLSADAETFAREIERRYEGRLGRMRLLSTRSCYPLVAVYANRFVSERFALVGDAAVGMHPVTAHGFNFGLLGADTLAASIAEAAAAGGDIGANPVLRRYETRHRRATLPLFLSTNAIARLYTDDRFPARVVRDAAIRVGSRLAPLRRAVVGRLMAGADGAHRAAARSSPAIAAARSSPAIAAARSILAIDKSGHGGSPAVDAMMSLSRLREEGSTDGPDDRRGFGSA